MSSFELRTMNHELRTKLIDTHCHLDFPEFDKDRDDVIKRAKEEGIDYIINVGTSLLSCEKALGLSKSYDFIYATVGLHPHEADKFDNQIGTALEELARKNKVVAIGETGLDYFKNYSQADGSTPLTISPEWNRRAENQRLLFRYLIKLAKDLKLPLVVHTRQAQDETLEILKEASPEKVQIHCFSGDEAFLKECLNLGFFISFTCNITYPVKLSNSRRDHAGVNNIVERDKKAQNLRELVKLAPLERLLLETDAPFLPPEGFRGKRNEPIYLKYLAQEVSRIKEIDIERVAQVTTENAKNFFNLNA